MPAISWWVTAVGAVVYLAALCQLYKTMRANVYKTVFDTTSGALTLLGAVMTSSPAIALFNPLEARDGLGFILAVLGICGYILLLTIGVWKLLERRQKHWRKEKQ